MLNVNKHKELCIELHNLAVKKDKAYGSSVEKAYKKRGLLSIIMRLEDKLNRLEVLEDDGNIDDLGETIRDTLVDIAGYAMLGVIQFDNDPNPVQKTKYIQTKMNLDEVNSNGTV